MFKKVPVLRGFTEINNLYDIVTKIKGCYILGGYVRYMCSPTAVPKPAGDIDIYSDSEETFEALLKCFKEEYSLEVKHENDVSVTFSKVTEGKLQFTPTIQIIKPVAKGAVVAVGDIETILDNFDFSVVRIGLVSKTEAMADIDFLEDEEKSTLRLKNIHCPVSSMLRCMKYARKGYWMRAIETLKLFKDWEDRDDEYKVKLVELLEVEDPSQEEIDELEWLLRID